MAEATLTPTEFLLARVAEDEAFAWQTARPPSLRHIMLADMRSTIAERIVAECEAKRRIVEEHWILIDAKGDDYCGVCAELAESTRIPWPCPTIRALASVYADHPDYREEWKS